jgi:NO-binding membrane sensor protein with MHYT domain/DNA-binding LytR/AlgR family response regulator
MLTVTYDPILVAVSVVVAIAASFTGLQLTTGINALGPAERKMVIAKAAIALGSGIWSMHFVGMLAVRLPIVIAYDALPTLISALLAILVVGLGLILLHFGVRTQRRIVAAGSLTGLGIVLMHYVGMAAVRGNCIIPYDGRGVALAVAIAVIASILALEFAYRRRTLGLTALGSIVLGLAISSMHYAAMIFTTFSLGSGVEMVGEPVLSTGGLAIVVSLAAFVLCGLFLLVAVPFAVAPEEARAAAVAAAPARLAARAAGSPGGHGRSTRDAAFSRAFTTPPERSQRTARIPYEQDQAIRFLTAHEIHAIRADGHYARLINGMGELFCPWSISKLEKVVAAAPFMRTHRSFLVNLDHVSGFKRDGDKGFCLLGSGAEQRVPVSRSYLPSVQKALGLG